MIVDTTRQQLIDTMRERLTAALAPSELTITDDSHKHIGHPGHQGAGHFTVHICSAVFADKSLIARHRMVYQALGSLMGQDIHALVIKASMPK